ncbi:MAG: periplasmic heavy metal sensor [Desulfovibrionales bacterium]|nr:periplasmic heavy metal sensor [Desulfovibrionales bacterium]
MMKTTRMIGLGLGLMAVLMLVSIAMARGDGINQSGQGNQGQLREDCPVYSNLSEEQQQKLLEVSKEHQDWMYPKKQEMISKQAQLNALLATEGADSAKIEQTKKDLISLNQELFQGKLNHKTQMSQQFGIKTGMNKYGQGAKNSFRSKGSAGHNNPRSKR